MKKLNYLEQVMKTLRLYPPGLTRNRPGGQRSKPPTRNCNYSRPLIRRLLRCLENACCTHSCHARPRKSPPTNLDLLHFSECEDEKDDHIEAGGSRSEARGDARVALPELALYVPFILPCKVYRWTPPAPEQHLLPVLTSLYDRVVLFSPVFRQLSGAARISGMKPSLVFLSSHQADICEGVTARRSPVPAWSTSSSSSATTREARHAAVSAPVPGLPFQLAL
ncbi:hypothetical protein V5799_025240 [Amblyomma americanum]|uniref:Uncharacterized protein n=1 Tax=Amblyomma americanum TaxID=6943 RepID=A0AAQ4E9V5_AMBAM